MDVPMSVTAIGNEAIEVKGLHNIDDLTRVAPGVTFLRNGMSSSGNYNDEDSDLDDVKRAAAEDVARVEQDDKYFGGDSSEEL